MIHFDHCRFDVEPENNKNFIILNDSEIPFKENLHFVTGDECRGTKPVNALGCGEYQCPDNEKCDKKYFDFGDVEDTYTLIPHTDINTPSRSPTKFFSESFYFTKSIFFSNSDMFGKSDYFSKISDFSKNGDFIEIKLSTLMTNEFCFSFYFTKSESFTLINRGPNQEKDGKISKGALAGINVGVIAAVALIILLVIFFIIKKKKSLEITADADADVMEGQESIVSIDNNLGDIMEKDDPFGKEFN